MSAINNVNGASDNADIYIDKKANNNVDNTNNEAHTNANNDTYNDFDSDANTDVDNANYDSNFVDVSVKEVGVVVTLIMILSWRCTSWTKTYVLLIINSYDKTNASI